MPAHQLRLVKLYPLRDLVSGKAYLLPQISRCNDLPLRQHRSQLGPLGKDLPRW